MITINHPLDRLLLRKKKRKARVKYDIEREGLNMDWMNGLNRILRINEEEIALLERMLAMAPNEHMRMILRNMITEESEESRVIRELMMGNHKDYMDPVF
jgi:succinate dehydrogenase flavin-adding protein (antitoxin of CptAB toxin-antitoxin module)